MGPAGSPDSRRHGAVVAALLVVGGVLAVSSLLGDSITFDETNHLTGGMSYWKTGDFRLSPETPPLAQLWAALPLTFVDQVWPPAQTPGWREGVVWLFGRIWLCELNDGEQLIVPARCAMVVLLLATCWCTYLLARRLFDRSVALVALLCAVLSPTLLAHGRLVTTDVPFTLTVLAVLLTFARLLDRLTLRRLAAAALCLTAASLTKFSWPTLLPAVGAMMVVAVVRSEPLSVRGVFARSVPLARARVPNRSGGSGGSPRPHGRDSEWSFIHARLARVVVLACACLCVGCLVYGAIWTCFLWRDSPFRGADAKRAMMTSIPRMDQPVPATMEEAWSTLVNDASGRPLPGVTLALVRWARRHHLLPEAYLYGFAHTLKFLQGLPSYLCGEHSTSGFRLYFPIAFAVKTPLATLGLAALGAVAAFTGMLRRPGDAPLLAGVIVFAFVWIASSLTTRYNIGHRHLLPIYPMVILLGGCAAAWMRSRWGTWLVSALVVWLAAANVFVHPHYLAYFNEILGGPSQGHRYLVDSNLDWGQDLKRLQRFARAHPGRTMRLAYFGSVDPSRYGFPCESLPSFLPFGPPAELDPGLYVVSATQLVGVFAPWARDDFWTAEVWTRVRALQAMLAGDSPQLDGVDATAARGHVYQELLELRHARLIQQLRRREPDARVGYSLFVYDLTADELERYTREPPMSGSGDPDRE